ncbi:tRNA (adenosine(37)-N6)-threonylcarbamoyltransferase complex ATPase subunit type 1 TsaE [Celeribacter sp.]|uniref:tRNA (adenosine(37)-N6)-threonylcarbamoyltransferase complex ATPase subunit type 1 TsaE n=1 Tax=Celeribacter sp. TaxID=1890673 RepID=UPI003A93EDB1
MAREIVKHVHSEEDTAQIASALAGLLHPGDVVLLDGALAAGKTFFTRALVRALGSDETVTSPTYTIANVYETPAGPLLHVDAYRLKGAQEFYHLGLEDYLDTGICVIEWGERIKDYFDAPLSIRIGFGDTDTARTVTLSASASRWTAVLEALA